jgi:hypothetical protein
MSTSKGKFQFEYFKDFVGEQWWWEGFEEEEPQKIKILFEFKLIVADSCCLPKKVSVLKRKLNF